MSTPTTQEEVKKELEDYLDAKVRFFGLPMLHERITRELDLS